jgi:carbon storage regulator
MLVLSRQVNESIILGEDILVTVVQLRGDRVVLQIKDSTKPERISSDEVQTISMERDDEYTVCDDVKISVVDIRAEKARIGVHGPKEMTVHRKEVYDAVRRENDAARRRRWDLGDDEDGGAGAGVPR